MIHANFLNGKLAVLWQCRKAKWQADMIVEIAFIRMALPAFAQNMRQHFLGARFANRTGNRDHCALKAFASGGRQIGQGGKAVGYNNLCHPDSVVRLGHKCRAGIGLGGFGEELMPIRSCPGQGHKQTAFTTATAINCNMVNRRRCNSRLSHSAVRICADFIDSP